ncbi:type IV pilin [Halorubrum tropicale]|uniref:type IV pilin n=1 Tax=Halorubrum tropicale TaxID=1765655 RepID=UPI00097F6C93|nr:type IV pilin N-terminal domain-containing protein [Halorubrum tropicale]
MNIKTAFQDSERAVSPVIGVILMVAITVILAAVIGTFVLGLGDSIGNSVTAGVTVEGENTTDATVTLANKGTAEDVRVSFSPDAGGSDANETISNVGESVSLGSDSGSPDFDEGGSVTIIAVGPDGEESLLRSFKVQ